MSELRFPNAERAGATGSGRARSIAARLLGVTLGLLLAVPTSFATHDADHRFTVYGVIRHGGEPVAGAPVHVTGLGGQPLGSGTTAADGSYQIVLHVHDDRIGRPFWVTVRGETRAGSFDFEAGDRETPRGRRIDFPG